MEGFLRYLDIWQDSLDERSARHKACTYTEQHNLERRGQTSMPWAGLEHAFPVCEQSLPAPHTRGHCDWMNVGVGLEKFENIWGTRQERFE
jgi:hypothetical protein